jgi:hypothetical protein
MIRKLFGKGLFKATAFICGIALLVYIGLEYPPVLTRLGNFNLGLISVGSAILPGKWGGVVENTLRFGFGADKALLVTEAVFLVKLPLWPIATLCRKIFGQRQTATA